MLELSACVAEGCEEFTFKDVTGPYDATDNPTGYGVENGVTGPAAFTSYELLIWYPGSNIEDDADFTYNLGASIPTPDADGFYSWVLTQEDLDLTKLVSGVWNFTLMGVLSPSTYVADVEKIFINDLKDQVYDLMKEYDPTCPCKAGCEDRADLFAQLLTITCGGICDPDKAQEAIDNLYAKTTNCC